MASSPQCRGEAPAWLHGRVSTTEVAEMFEKHKNLDGLFFVRRNRKHEMYLALCYKKTVHQYPITSLPNGGIAVNDVPVPPYKYLDDVILTLAGTKAAKKVGLKYQLKHPCETRDIDAAMTRVAHKSRRLKNPQRHIENDLSQESDLDNPALHAYDSLDMLAGNNNEYDMPEEDTSYAPFRNLTTTEGSALPHNSTTAIDANGDDYRMFVPGAEPLIQYDSIELQQQNQQPETYAVFRSPSQSSTSGQTEAQQPEAQYSQPHKGAKGAAHTSLQGCADPRMSTLSLYDTADVFNPEVNGVAIETMGRKGAIEKIMKFADHNGLAPLDAGLNGAFLVRHSEKKNGGYVISMWYNGKDYHYKLAKRDKDGAQQFYIDTKSKSVSGTRRSFATIQELVDHYHGPTSIIAGSLLHFVGDIDSSV